MTRNTQRIDIPAGLCAALVFVLILTACPSPTGGNGSGGGGDTPLPAAFVSGSFNGGTVVFGLDQVSAQPSSASVMRRSVQRSVNADAGNTLEGVLIDDDIAVRLRGMYDPDTGNWSVSARYGSAIYTVDGAFDNATGDSRGAIATVVAQESGRWNPYAFPVTEGGVNIANPNTAAASETSGLPSGAQGTWSCDTLPNYITGGSINATCLISDWKMYVTGMKTVGYISTALNQDVTILEVIDEGGGSYGVIYCYPEYVMTAGDLAKALAEYLGKAENEITPLNAAPASGSEPSIYVYMDGDSPTIGGNGLIRDDYASLTIFWKTDAWKRWAARNNINTENRYERYKVSFPAGATGDTLEMTQMVAGTFGGYTYYFDTQEALEAATLAPEQEGYYEGGNSYPTYVTKVTTYTRQ